ncbi:hypothetical protein [Kosakonia cowanii]|uniref:hypothetical protein n=1 Tax=Kosakonia cowanii TaxID=208223 RepID=UPI003D967608
MKSERFHLVMRYSYWNELCARTHGPSAAGSLLLFIDEQVNPSFSAPLEVISADAGQAQ